MQHKSWTDELCAIAGSRSLPRAFLLIALFMLFFCAAVFAQPHLSVNSVSPGSATTSGDTTITVFGSGFTDGMEVWFGAERAEVVDVGENTIDVIAPAHVAGEVQVSVMDADGVSTHSGYIFTYVNGGGSASAAHTLSPPSSAAEAVIAMVDPATGFLPWPLQ